MPRLTIPDEPTFAEFTVTTPTSVFPIAFALNAKEDLTVLVDNVALLQSGFTFSGTLLDGGGYQGGTVTLNTAVDDVAVRIERNVPIRRSSNFAPSNSVPVGSVDGALNRLTMQQQDLNRKGALALSTANSALAAASSVYDFSVLPRLSVPTIAALKLLLPGLVTSVWVEEDGRQGVFVWDATDQSTLVAADARNGVSAAPALFPTGAQGCWRRNYEGGVWLDWFGAGKGVPADDQAAWAGAMTLLRLTGIKLLRLAAKEYWQTATVILPPGTRLKMDGKYDWWMQEATGGVIRTFGPGNPQRYTDVDGADGNETPQFVCGGNSVYFENVTLITDPAQPWSIGLFAPCVKQCGFNGLYAFNHTKAPVYLDCTWSSTNETLKALHPEIEPDTGMNEFLGEDFYLNGSTGASGAPGIMIKGTTRNPDDYPDPEDWVWAPGGGSDIVFQNGRCSGWVIDAAVNNTAKTIQGVRFVNVNPRTSTRDVMMIIDRANRVEVFGGYGEAGDGTTAQIHFTSRTGAVSFIGGRYIRNLVYFNGVSTGQELDVYEAPFLTRLTYDGILRVQGVTIEQTAVRPATDNTGSLGTASKNWALTRTRAIRADAGALNVRAATGIDFAPTSSAVRGYFDSNGFYAKPNGTDIRLSVTDAITTIANALGLPGGVRVVTNAGSPEGVVAAAPGSFCLNSSGGRPYSKNAGSGSGNTGWTIFT